MRKIEEEEMQGKKNQETKSKAGWKKGKIF